MVVDATDCARSLVDEQATMVARNAAVVVKRAKEFGMASNAQGNPSREAASG
jgi:hypothetical protein